VEVSTPTLHVAGYSHVACVWNVLSGNDFKRGVVFGVASSSAEAWRWFWFCAATGLVRNVAYGQNASGEGTFASLCWVHIKQIFRAACLSLTTKLINHETDTP